MKEIKTIEIGFNEELDEESDEEEYSEGYSFDCPYCGKKHVLPDDIDCRHYWFGYESINCQPLEMKQSLYDAIEEKLLNHRTKGPETFSDLWLGEYRPEKEYAECYQEEYDEARCECVNYYLGSLISIDDVIWFMDRLPQFKGFRDHAAIAVVDDGEGNSTSYLFLDDSFSD